MKLFMSALLAVIGISLAMRCPHYKVKVVQRTAKNAHGLNGAVDEFRHLLGGKNNMAGPPQKDGRREINWDGAAPFYMPKDFFNRVAPLGAVFHTKFDLFAISNPVDEPIKDDKFSFLNRVAAKDFIAFSEKRLFTSVLDEKMSTTFFVPGTKDAATVSGFGAVYNDVDLPHTSFLELKDTKGCRIAKVFVEPRNKGLSFVGIVPYAVKYHGKHHFKNVNAPVYKATLKMGNAPLVGYKKQHGKFNDFVVTDDFIYGEPQKISKH